MGLYEDRWNEIEPTVREILVHADNDYAVNLAALNQLKGQFDSLTVDYNTLLLEHEKIKKALEECQGNKENPKLAQVGIQVFPERRDLSYWDHEGTFQMLEYLGIKNIRGNVRPTTTQRTIDFFNRCYDELGIESCLTIGEPRVELTAAEWDSIGSILSMMRGVKRLSNWNEPNHRRSKDAAPLFEWWLKTGRHGNAIWNRYRNDYIITSMQMWAGNLNDHDADLDKVAPYVNGTFHEIAWHLYQVGLDKVLRFENKYFGLFGELPVVCTETGMSTAPNQRQIAASMTEEEQAKYITLHIDRDYVSRGHTVYWFETRDEFDPEGTDREDWLGIFRHDGSPKPAATALKEYLAAA